MDPTQPRCEWAPGVNLVGYEADVVACTGTTSCFTFTEIPYLLTVNTFSPGISFCLTTSVLQIDYFWCILALGTLLAAKHVVSTLILT